MWIVTALLVSAACPRASTPTRGLEILEPPTGEGCDQMRSCCEAMLLLEPGLELACQLSSARGGDCMEMIETTTAIYQGLTQQAPPALCGALPGR
ncbi:MAG TPA: hypothetical protein ENK18_13205 [Deltaproteobacteria bacterium]|nr:hypothetical protein [Deltaproteobacteria bacterium]